MAEDLFRPEEATLYQHDYSPMLPHEILREVFDEVMDTEPSDIFNLSYVRRSLALSHVSSHWHQVSLSAPSYWPIFDKLHPDAWAVFAHRTRHAGIFAKIDQPDRYTEAESEDGEMEGDAGGHSQPNPRCDQFLTFLLERFDQLKVLHASINSKSVLRSIIECGRQHAMTRLTDVALKFNGTMVNNVVMNGHGKLDWDMPSITTISCRNILPCLQTPCPAARIDLFISERGHFNIPLSTLRRHLSQLTSLDFGLPPSGIFFSDGPPGMNEPLAFPNMEQLRVYVAPAEQTNALVNYNTLRQCRFPKLDRLTIMIPYDLDFESQQPLRSLSPMLSSMKLLRSITLVSTQVVLEDILSDKVFPCLEECKIIAAYSVEVTAEAPGERISQELPCLLFPKSLKRVEFKGCVNTTFYDNALPHLLLALQDQLDGDNKCSIFVCASMKDPKELREGVRKHLGAGEAAIKMLIVA